MTREELVKRIAYLEATISSMLWYGAHIYPAQWAVEFDANCAKRYKFKKSRPAKGKGE